MVVIRLSLGSIAAMLKSVMCTCPGGREGPQRALRPFSPVAQPRFPLEASGASSVNFCMHLGCWQWKLLFCPEDRPVWSIRNPPAARTWYAKMSLCKSVVQPQEVLTLGTKRQFLSATFLSWYITCSYREGGSQVLFEMSNFQGFLRGSFFFFFPKRQTLSLQSRRECRHSRSPNNVVSLNVVWL